MAALKPGGIGQLPQPGRLGRCRVNLSLCAWRTGGVASGDWDKTLGGPACASGNPPCAGNGVLPVTIKTSRPKHFKRGVRVAVMPIPA
ncbi:hypothetical protein [Candidatus Methylobacter favarea]|uniref:hypothetical protein n=1 Tax=Candidatus Methylobacter favarea TaxID=2707345 RepID=UPI00157C894C|nr:hypothetical protein [Candidatus Methylobacter favarea]